MKIIITILICASWREKEDLVGHEPCILNFCFTKSTGSGDASLQITLLKVEEELGGIGPSESQWYGQMKQ